ncbi:MAG: nucleotidyltransferase domain-containing protein [Ignavibacteriae bacterium]|nr:nucleotidyltransferase domain-containing protein [Ignavibacteriota bacterium]
MLIFKAKMNLSDHEKENLKKRIVEKLQLQTEIDKIVIFGSFLKDRNPNDIDLAIFQNSNENYLTLSLKYRKAVREISKKIPIDIIPLLSNKFNEFIKNEIETGEVIFERGN